MITGGVTDVNTARSVAKKLYANYSNGSSIEKHALEKMLIDTYKIMVLFALSLEQGLSTNKPRPKLIRKHS